MPEFSQPSGGGGGRKAAGPYGGGTPVRHENGAAVPLSTGDRARVERMVGWKGDLPSTTTPRHGVHAAVDPATGERVVDPVTGQEIIVDETLAVDAAAIARLRQQTNGYSDVANGGEKQ